MNEMRKLMEMVEESSQKTAKDVLQYFSNQRQGGSLRSGYSANISFDGNTYDVDRINILRSRGSRTTFHISGARNNGYQVTEQQIASIEIYELNRVL